MEYVLRLQALDGYKDKFDDVFHSRFTRVLCVHHTGRKGDNPHYHFCLTTDYNKQALRVYLKKHFNLATGNKHLSLKDWDGDTKACSYLFHEGTEPVMNRGFTQQEIDTFKTINEGIKKEIKKNAPAKIVEDATEYFTPIQQSRKYRVSHKEIFIWIMNRLRENGDWLPNKYQMDRWIARIQANIFDDREFESWLKDTYEMWYGQCSW